MILSWLRAALRFVFVTLALASSYLLLQHLWLGLVGLGVVQGWLQGQGQAALVRQAAEVSERSRLLEERLPAERRVQAFQLGFQLGFVARWLADEALFDAPVRRRVEVGLHARIEDADRLAEAMGVAPARWPQADTLARFVRLQNSFEADGSGLAGRIEITLSPRHRELYLAGVHAGINAAVARASGGVNLDVRSARGLVQHATLAGLLPAAFEALTRRPAGNTPEARWAAYLASLDVLENAIAAPPAGR